MNCELCGSDTHVFDSRPSKTCNVRRRRVCKACGHRFTTYEMSVSQASKAVTLQAIRLIRQAGLTGPILAACLAALPQTSDTPTTEATV